MPDTSPLPETHVVPFLGSLLGTQTDTEAQSITIVIAYVVYDGYRNFNNFTITQMTYDWPNVFRIDRYLAIDVYRGVRQILMRD